ncbi:MAG: PD-(D/E)XK nuclease family protein [Saprospiraceae bacterium]
MQTLHFGVQFDGNVHTPDRPAESGTVYCGEKKLLQFLETHLALEGYPANTDYLRIELYRQALQQHLQAEPTAFFARSFEADRFATATALLNWRDELLLGGWWTETTLDGRQAEELPARLATFRAVEVIFRKKLAEPPANVQAFGFADRFEQVLAALPERLLPLEKLVLHEPEPLLSPHIQRFVKIITDKNIPVEPASGFDGAADGSTLAWLQRRLAGQTTEKSDSPNDGSLLILKAKRDADAAVFLAQTLAQNLATRPLFLVPEMSLLLEQALRQEGFPAMGILSASLARPSLQVLKLAPAFIWEPVDVFKIMEFATLPVKPMDDDLADIVAGALAEKPGLFNDTWFARIYEYLENADTPEEARKQYEFWFNRRRYRADQSAPKTDVSLIYNYLREWAIEHFEKTGSKNPSLLVLAEQARRIHDLLETIPETRLTFLELERIVRTIYQPAPVQFAAPEKRHFEFIHAPGAFAAPADTVFWWNCTHDEPAPLPERWSPAERQYLENEGVIVPTAQQQTQLRLLLRCRPVLASRERLVLVVPESVNGKAAEPSLLLGDIEAAFKNTASFTFDIDDAHGRAGLAKWLRLPTTTEVPNEAAAPPPPQLSLSHPELLQLPEYETLTNLESLFYYPHRWFFKQKLKLYPASILSVTGDHTLLGNLAHRFFELLLAEPGHADFDRQTVSDWLDAQAEDLLKKEGATLLLYGREPERNQFLNRVKNAAWSLLLQLRKNGWRVQSTEQQLVGRFVDVEVRGKADLVLARDNGEQAIVDLKWSGAKRRREMIQNYEDLQLVMYAKLLPPEQDWAHTAYFILENGKMIARNKQAFAEAEVGGTGEDHRAANELIFNKMEQTYCWRMKQLLAGKLEIRTARTLAELDFLYADELLDLLEMKNEPARWDDYRTLVG